MQLHYPLNPATGVEDPTQLPWTNGVPQTGQDGSFPPYQAVVETMTEVVNTISLSGQTPTDTDPNQLARAIRGGQLDFDATDTGSADAVLCQVALAHNQLQAGLPFTFIKGPNANTGNAVPTLTITNANGNNGLTGTIVKSGGGPLAKGDLPANALITVRARAPGVFAVISLLTISDVIAQIPSQLAALKIPGSILARYTTPGTSTLNLAANVAFEVEECRGGGGGGGGAASTTSGASGGGGGGRARGFYATTVATVLQIAVGVGGPAGQGGSSPTNGGTGGSSGVTVVSGSVVNQAGTVFGPGQSIILATGGTGGGAASGTVQTTYYGLGGAGSGGDLNDTGDQGGLANGPGPYTGGNGGASPYSGGPNAGPYGSAGFTSTAPGTGGNGSTANGPGGTGSPGRVTIRHA